MLRLTSLAPDIIEAILRGDMSRRSAAETDEPDGLSLENLRKLVLSTVEGPALSPLPVRWNEQRDMLDEDLTSVMTR